MKAILLILLIAIGGYAAWQQQTTRSTIAAAEARINEIEADLKSAKADLKDAEKALAKAGGSTASTKTASTLSAVATNPTSAGPVVEIPGGSPVVDRAAALPARLEELRTIYEGHRAKFDGQKATVTRNLSAARTQYETLRSNQPQFSEQGDRYDSFGNRIGGTGVRTSQADREREIAKHNEQVAQATSMIDAAETALVTLSAEMDRLQRSYDDAVYNATQEARK